MEPLEPAIIIVILILGAALFFLIWSLLPSGKEFSLEFRLGETAKERVTGSLFLKYSRPAFTKLFMGILSQMDFENYKKTMERKLVTAGLKKEIEPLEVIAFKIWMAIVFPLLLWFFSWGMEIISPFYIFAGISILGFFYPDIWINSTRKARQKAITISLPFVVDLLCLSTEAGLDFVGSVARVVEKAKAGPFVEELEQFLNETRLGATRVEALNNLAWRVDMMEIDTFCGMLRSASEMGSSIGPVLRAQSEQIRHERFIKAEKAGQAASQKILFPLIFFILPAVFIMIFGPIIVKLITQGRPF